MRQDPAQERRPAAGQGPQGADSSTPRGQESATGEVHQVRERESNDGESDSGGQDDHQAGDASGREGQETDDCDASRHLRNDIILGDIGHSPAAISNHLADLTLCLAHIA